MSELDLPRLAADLERLLKLKSVPFGMKLFENAAELDEIPRLRRPKHIHTLDQVVAQAARLGWTVGVTAENLVGAQCRAVIGLGHAAHGDVPLPADFTDRELRIAVTLAAEIAALRDAGRGPRADPGRPHGPVQGGAGGRCR